MRDEYKPVKTGVPSMNEPPYEFSRWWSRSYPDMYSVYESVSDFLQVDKQNIIVGNGCEGTMKSVLFAIKPEKLSFSVPCWGFLDVYSQQIGFKLDKHDYKLNGKVMEDDDFNEIDVYYATWPANNYLPTRINGRNMNSSRFSVIDVTYSTPKQIVSLSKSIDVHGKTILVGSFDKLFGCGLRLGFAVFPNEISEQVNIHREQFISSAAERAARELSLNQKIYENNFSDMWKILPERTRERCFYVGNNYFVVNGHHNELNGRLFSVDGMNFTRFGIPENAGENLNELIDLVERT